MSYKDKCTKGDSFYQENQISSSFPEGQFTIKVGEGETPIAALPLPRSSAAARMQESNSHLICEAFNVLNETGYTPRELADNFKTCLEHLETLVAAQHVQDPNANSVLGRANAFVELFKTK